MMVLMRAVVVVMMLMRAVVVVAMTRVVMRVWWLY